MKRGCSNLACPTPSLKVRGNWCTGSKCKELRATLNPKHQMLAAGVGLEDDGTACYEVYDVYGVSCCDISKLDKVQRRNELEDERWSYEIFGRFATSEVDNGYDDTRARCRCASC